MTALRQTRDRSKKTSRSRQRSIDESDSYPSQHQHPEPVSGAKAAAGTKRLFSNRDTRLANTVEHQYTEHNGQHSEKRQRASDWPLSASPSESTSPRHIPRSRQVSTATTPSSLRVCSQARPSKFQEGSMNDRVSQKPPIPYVEPRDGDDGDNTMDGYEYEYTGRKGKMSESRRTGSYLNNPMVEASVVSPSDISRTSSLFRFGRSLASSFNPSNWRIWKHQAPQGAEERTTKAAATEQRVRTERQVKAEKIYRELKQSGHFRDSPFPQNGFGGMIEPNPAHSKHDSGVIFGDSEANSHRRFSIDSDMTAAEKRKGRVFLETPTNVAKFSRASSPASNVGSVVRSRAPTPSSGLHVKMSSRSEARTSFASDRGTLDGRAGSETAARRIPSRKDLQKQQKLVKRVSDLEGKLQAARRQLCEAMSEPLPATATTTIQTPSQRVARSRFVPGAMPTLPSERLLSGYLASDSPGSDDNDEGGEIGRAVSLDQTRDMVPTSSDVRRERPQSESRTAETQLSPIWTGESLGRLGDLGPGGLCQSVESDEILKTEVSKQVASLGAHARYESNSISILNDLGYEGQLVTPKLEKGASKKRKALLVDDSGSYKPDTVSESEPASPVKKITPRKKNIKGQPLKLQVAAKPSTPKSSPCTPAKLSEPLVENRRTSAQRFVGPPPKSIKTSQFATPATSTQEALLPHANTHATKKPAPAHNSRRLTKTRTGRQPRTRGRQSGSPSPPTPSILPVGEEATQPQNLDSSHDRKLPSSTFSSPNAPEADDKVPPMPNIPPTVRLPTGEVVSTARHARASSTVSSHASRAPTRSQQSDGRVGVKTAEKSHSEAGASRDKEKEKEHTMANITASISTASFDWDKDVF